MAQLQDQQIPGKDFDFERFGTSRAPGSGDPVVLLHRYDLYHFLGFQLNSTGQGLGTLNSCIPVDDDTRSEMAIKRTL